MCWDVKSYNKDNRVDQVRNNKYVKQNKDVEN